MQEQVLGTRRVGIWLDAFVGFFIVATLTVACMPFWHSLILNSAEASFKYMALHSLGLFTVFSPPLLLLVMYYRFERASESLRLDNSGCQTVGLFFQAKKVAWEDVVEVDFNPLLGTIVIRSSQATLRIRNYFEDERRGIEIFFRHLPQDCRKSKLILLLEESLDSQDGEIHPFFSKTNLYYYLYYRWNIK